MDCHLDGFGKSSETSCHAWQLKLENLKQRAFKEKKIVDEALAIADALKALEIKISSQRRLLRNRIWSL